MCVCVNALVCKLMDALIVCTDVSVCGIGCGLVCTHLVCPPVCARVCTRARVCHLRKFTGTISGNGQSGENWAIRGVFSLQKWWEITPWVAGTGSCIEYQGIGLRIMACNLRKWPQWKWGKMGRGMEGNGEKFWGLLIGNMEQPVLFLQCCFFFIPSPWPWNMCTPATVCLSLKWICNCKFAKTNQEKDGTEERRRRHRRPELDLVNQARPELSTNDCIANTMWRN